MKKQQFVNLVTGILLLFILGLFPLPKRTDVQAEQSGSSPESGRSSRLETAYDFLVGKGVNYGVTDALDWDSSVTYIWDTYWNRIMESAAWEPDGTLAVGEVSPGKTFYAGSSDRDQKTGTGTIYSNQALQVYDDYKDTSGTSGEYIGEEATWTETAGNMDGDCKDTNDVCKDTKTGLYWSDKYVGIGSTKPNNFTVSTCAFFSQTDPGDYDGTDTDCGAIGNDETEQALNYCATLELDSNNAVPAETDWYLPSQKELMQAYIDGSENNIVSAHPGSPVLYWSSTEVSGDPTLAWSVYLFLGDTDYNTKGAAYWVRCVRRD